jgi:hypothetical protein
MMYTAARPPGLREQLVQGRLSGRQERARERGPECVEALTATNNGRCVAVGATSGGGGNSTGLSMTAGAATSKTGSGAVVRVARQSVDGGEPAGTPKVPVPRVRGTGAGVRRLHATFVAPADG